MVAAVTEGGRAAGNSVPTAQRARSRAVLSRCRRSHSARTIASASSSTVSVSVSVINLFTSFDGMLAAAGSRGQALMASLS